MDKKLYIHIGGPKTGTTALQLFLAQNRQALERKGFCYPGNEDAHWGICANLQEHTLSGIQARPHTFVRRCVDEVLRSSCHTSILSAECLAGQGSAAILAELIPRSLDVRVIYYARRQDFLIESWYNQMVKSSRYRMTNRLDEELLRKIYPMILFDHTRVITPWAESFGRDNVIVRCYEKRQMKGDIIKDFAAATALSIDETFSRPGEKINSSLDLYHTEFIRLCNQAFPDAPEINDFFIEHRFHQSRFFENRPKQNLLSPKARIEILENYQGSNQHIAREYLGRDDGHLFYDPWPAPDDPWEPPRSITAEDLAPIITEMITNLDLQKRKKEPLATLFWYLNKAARKGKFIIPEAIRRAIGIRADRLKKPA